MSNITEAWDKERLAYQQRYIMWLKKWYEFHNEDYRGHANECSYVLPESVKFHFYKNQPINVAIFYRLHTDYNQSYRSKGHTTPPLNFNNQFIMTY